MSRRRRPPRQRGWAELAVLLVLGVIVGGVVILKPAWLFADAAPAEATELTVRYRTDAPADATVAKPWLEVINTSERTVELSDVTVRYHFTADDGAAHGSNCVQTSLGCTNITGRISPPAADAASGGGQYLQIGFSPAAGSLKPGDSSEGIGLQLYRLDHKELNQADDPSYDAELTHYAPSKRLTAYLRGKAVWGDEPGSDGSAQPEGTTSPATSAASAAAPEGVLFDDFHYTGPDDPALASNGWQVRNGEGGPGISDTWTAAGVTFPSETDAEGAQEEQTVQLRAETDGTEQGTRQSELQTSHPIARAGTLAARIRFSDEPTSGPDGDHISQSFFTISPRHTSSKYSELDYEYMPNGGWGAKGPRLDTTSWRSSKDGDRVTRATEESLAGWHTMVITAVDGDVTYSMDGRKLFTNGSGHFPRESMGIHFSAWFIDLPFKDPRTWDMQVDWVYYEADRKVPLEEISKTVAGFSDRGTGYVNTLPSP